MDTLGGPQSALKDATAALVLFSFLRSSRLRIGMLKIADHHKSSCPNAVNDSFFRRKGQRQLATKRSNASCIVEKIGHSLLSTQWNLLS